MVSSVQNHERPQTTIIANYYINPCYEPLKKFISGTAERIRVKNKQRSPGSKNQSLLRTMFKSLDDFIRDNIDLPLRLSIEPTHVLFGNFAPVEELPPTSCEVVEGSLPSCLDGVYIRNGPNPQFIPRGPYHLFDGDGMLHMIKISGGKATFCSRYVNTYKYMVEREIGHPIFPSAFSSFNGIMASMGRVMLIIARVLAREFNPVNNGFGLANTSVALIGGKLYALGESDLPYEIQVTSDGDIITIGRHDFHATKPFLSMTAHPKMDPETGEAFAFRYHVVPPLLTFFRIDSDGTKQPDVPIFSMKSTALMHDFAVTKNYAIFNDVQMVMSPLQILKGRQPMRVDPVKIPRLGIIDRHAEDDKEMWWTDVPGLNISHAVNAWEEDDGDSLVLIGTNITTVELSLQSLDMAELTLEEIRISMKEKKVVSRHPLSTKVHDLAIINQAYIGKKNR